jgi:hypothetical protein
MLAIAIEHALFIIKFLVAALTEDVPNSVKLRESKQDDFEHNANKFIEKRKKLS